MITGTDPASDAAPSNDSETSTVSIVVVTINPVSSGGRLLALADAEILLDGVAIGLHGLQVYADSSKTEIRLPKYRAPNGDWLPAISLPPELKEPLGDAVMAAGIEAGILKERGTATV